MDGTPPQKKNQLLIVQKVTQRVIMKQRYSGLDIKKNSTVHVPTKHEYNTWTLDIIISFWQDFLST